MKITKNDLIVKTGRERCIAHKENSIITAMHNAAKHVGVYNSPDTYCDPTFSICNAEDVENPSKYIVRGLTGWRYTGHDTIEFDNANARSYMRITVDMNVNDLSEKCAVFDNGGKVDSENVVYFDKFITEKDIYRFVFEIDKDPIFKLFENGERMIFGEIKYLSYSGEITAFGMLGIERRPISLVFIHADSDHRIQRFHLKDLSIIPQFEFEIHDCRVEEV